MDDKDQGHKTSLCPICKKPGIAPYLPFCSTRCANVDLGRWLGEVYTVPVVENDEEDVAELEAVTLPPEA